MNSWPVRAGPGVGEKNNGVVSGTKQFVWSGTDLCEERDGGDNVTRRFFAEGEQMGGANYYFTRDHLGSVREMTDSSGAVRAEYDYDPYGVQTKVQGDLDADFGYAGYYRHAPSGLDLTLFRAYDPSLGRWLSRDPIGETGGLNPYDYVQDNPVDFGDPMGLVSVPMPPDPPPGASCAVIFKFLQQLARHVRGRYNDLLADKQFLYKNNSTKWENHLDEFDTQQRRLNKWIDQFKKKCGGPGGGMPIPSWVYVEADRKAPSKPLWAESNSSWTDWIPGSPGALNAAGRASWYVGAGALTLAGAGVLGDLLGAGGEILDPVPAPN